MFDFQNFIIVRIISRALYTRVNDVPNKRPQILRIRLRTKIIITLIMLLPLESTFFA